MIATTTLHPDIHYWLAAARIPGLGPVTIRHWFHLFNNIKTLFSASKSELEYAGLSEKQINILQYPDWQAVERDIQWCQKNNCHIISLAENGYPKLLQETVDPPLVLFVRGEIELLTKPQLAIVGSRNPTITGKELAEQFGYYLTKTGLIITSGLALGIDAASHKGAISAGGKTIAVLGAGLNCIYPAANQKLAEEISFNGALVSEFTPHQMPRAKNFPRRNRIISGLSLGVLVIEAALRSGSLITARFAVEQGREVFAIPGSIHNPLARGCHQLIQTGAKLVETAKDIIEELGSLCAFALPAHNDCKIPNKVKLDVKSICLLAQIGYEVTALDAIILRSGLTAGEVSSILLSLELQGYVQNVQGGYARCREI